MQELPGTDRIEEPQGEAAPEAEQPKARTRKAAPKAAQAKQPRAPKAAAPAKADAAALETDAPAEADAAVLEADASEKAETPAGKGKGSPTKARGGKAAEPAKAQSLEGYTARLRERYLKEIAPALMAEFSYKNPMEVPRVVKVVLNIGLGEVKDNPKVLEAAQRDLMAITGQRPVTTRAKKSIANFKLREGMAIGMMVTLRGARLYEFLDRLASIAMPRIRDFRGIPTNGFDGRGNYSMGLREQVMFPEVDFNDIDKIRGMQITVVTTARNDEQARRLLTLLGFAFEKTPNAQAA